MFYKAVVQSVLLYGCETWVITPAVQRTLDGFHNRVTRQIAGRQPRRVNGEWVYPPIAEARELAGLWPLNEYVRRRQQTLVDTIAARPILELCKAATRPSGSPRRQWWWTHAPTPTGGEEAVEDEEEDDSS